MIRRRLLNQYIEATEEEAARLRSLGDNYQTVKIELKTGADPPAVPENLVRGILELQTKWLKLRNTSPVAAFEIRRHQPEETWIQFAAPTHRLERKIRTQLAETEPEIELHEGSTGLPVYTGDTVGGALLTTGRRDWYPLKTGFDHPPNNAVISALHRHAMQDTRFTVQILFQPVAGQPLRRWWWKRRTYQRIGYLRKEKEKLWGSRSPTPREKQQANQVERKAGTAKFHTSIRVIVINAADHTASRVKELGGAYNRFENPDTGQYLNIDTVQTLRRSSLLNFAEITVQHQFGPWSRSFRTSVNELAALTSLPHRRQ